MCVPPALRFMGVEVLFYLQEFRLQQSRLGLLQLFYLYLCYKLYLHCSL